ncbi:MAG: winged helix-turn-helix domain-containing protein, partial [Nitratireductor sp.]
GCRVARLTFHSEAKRELKHSGKLVKLTDRERDIMVIFAERAGETVPRHELVGEDSEVGERTIDVQINRLRRKIERDPSNPVYLQTVRGIGYRLSVE